MRDPPSKNKQKIKELTTKLLFHSFEIIQLFDECSLHPLTDFVGYYSLFTHFVTPTNSVITLTHGDRFVKRFLQNW